MKEGLIYADGSFQDREQIDQRLQMMDRGFIVAQPSFVQPPKMERFIARQEQVKEPEPNLQFYFPREPIINVMSDLHIGGDCDYHRIQDELNAVMDKPDSFVILDGDIVDNFSFNPAQFEDMEAVPEQLKLAQEIIDRLIEGNRLLAVIGGNHEFWSKKMGINLEEMLVRGRVPVVNGVNYFTFNVQGTEYKATMAHALAGHSMYNNTHPQMREANFGAEGADIIVGGHTHRRGMSQASKKEHGGQARQVLYLSTGTYKYGDGYGDNKGFHKQSSPEMGGYAVKLRKQKGNFQVGDILEMNR